MLICSHLGRRGSGVHGGDYLLLIDKIYAAALNRRGGLRCLRPLRRLNNNALAGARKGEGSGGVLALPAGPEERVVALVAPLKAVIDLFCFHRPAAIVFIFGTERPSRLAAADIERVFGLTPAEARMVRVLLEEFSLNEYADKARVRVATVRTQLKQIFVKTGATSQSALMRLILADPVFAISAARHQ
jgi:DNA-binding CsgD family transcriptional regulator